MPTYISLINLTEQGIKEVKNAPERLQAFDAAAREIGGQLVGFYLVMGQYDYVVINSDLDRAFIEARSILCAERLKRERQPGLSDFVRRLQTEL